MRLALTVLAVALMVPSVARAHPMHNTITEVTEDRTAGTVRAVIRVFADDFATVLGRGKLARLERAEAALAYVRSTFVLADRAGRPLALRSCGLKEVSGVVWVCVEGNIREGLAPLALSARVLCDLYADQINLVYATVAGVRKTFLFTRGASPRPLG